MLRTIRIVMAAFFVLPPLLAQAVTATSTAREKNVGDHVESQVFSAPVSAVAPSITGNPWRLKELMGESLPGEQEAPHLLFTNAGDLIGFGGCNYFVGKYRTGDDGRIIVSAMRASHQQCQESSKRETNLLTSLVLANTLQVGDDGLTFFMNGNNLMKLSHAPEISVDELTRQGVLLKKHKARAHKARGKKKKVITKSKGYPKSAVPKISGKIRPAATKTAKPH